MSMLNTFAPNFCLCPAKHYRSRPDALGIFIGSPAAMAKAVPGKPIQLILKTAWVEYNSQGRGPAPYPDAKRPHRQTDPGSAGQVIPTFDRNYRVFIGILQTETLAFLFCYI